MDKKLCGTCGEIKLLTEFSKDAGRKDGCQRRCKPCAKAYRDANRDRALAYNREYYPKYYQENREAVMKRQSDRIKRNPTRRRKYERDYRKLNADKVRYNTAKYKALKVSVTTTDPWELAEIALFYSDCPKGYEVDHIMPLNLGGKHELSNLQHLIMSDNRSKQDKHPDDWDDPRPISCRA